MINIGNKKVIKIGVVLISVLFVNFIPLVKQLPVAYSAEKASASTPAGVYLPVIVHGKSDGGSPGPGPELPPDGAGWLEYLNFYRTTAGLPALSSNETWSEADWLHSRYMVKNDYVDHSEDPENVWFTAEGDEAAKSSNLVGTSNPTASDQEAFDLWMQAPFHAVGILDPELQEVGYGSFRLEDGGLQMGASLDIIHGLQGVPGSVSFPIAWPGDGTSVPLTSHYTEYPDPLSSCPGYQKPAGLPIILQIGAGGKTPNVSAHSFKQGSQLLESCIFDETSYVNPDANAQNLGRAVLDNRDAIVLIPRQPLTPGKTYTVSITVNGDKYTWSFSVLGTANQAEMLSTLTAGSPEIVVK
jgi:uncharacterized protein YkwD